MTMEEIKKFLEKNKIRWSENEIGQIEVRRCEVTGTGYGYFDDYTPIPTSLKGKYKKFDFLLNDEKINILDCENCCSCGDW